MTATDELDAVLTESQARGFIGPGSIASHRRHAEAFVPLVPSGARLGADLGTGGGLPGLVLAVQRPEVHWTFVESSQTRAQFLTHAVARLGLEVDVLADRVEQLGRGAGRETFDVVTARSFGLPAVVAECAAPLLVLGGVLVVSEPPEGEVIVRWPEAQLAELGLGAAELVAGPPRLARITRVGPCPPDVPRKVGRPAKRPRF